MPRSNILGVWLHGQPLGELEKLRNGELRLRFDPAVVDSYGAGTHLVSLALPLTTKRVQGEHLKLFVRGLLPEPPIRALIEARDRVPFDDDFELLKVVGGECAGALQFLPDETEPDDGVLRQLTTAEVDTLVGDLPTIGAPDELPVGASLGGIQAKVLLTKTDDGWAWPAYGAMSTHLIKPAPLNGGLPGLLEAEWWSGEVARRMGLSAAASSLQSFGDRRALVVTRYDRHAGRRSHQEDFAQALSLRPSDKYELGSTRPGRLQRIATTAGALAVDEHQFRRDLLRAVAFNVLLGNSDAHSKNYSLLISEDGSFSVAPLYDSAPIMLMDANYKFAGQSIDGQTRLAFITGNHLVREAVSWGMGQDRAEQIVRDLASLLASTAAAVAAPDELGDLPTLVADRANRFAGHLTGG